MLSLINTPSLSFLPSLFRPLFFQHLAATSFDPNSISLSTLSFLTHILSIFRPFLSRPRFSLSLLTFSLSFNSSFLQHLVDAWNLTLSLDPNFLSQPSPYQNFLSATFCCYMKFNPLSLSTFFQLSHSQHDVDVASSSTLSQLSLYFNLDFCF